MGPAESSEIEIQQVNVEALERLDRLFQNNSAKCRGGRRYVRWHPCWRRGSSAPMAAGADWMFGVAQDGMLVSIGNGALALERGILALWGLTTRGLCPKGPIDRTNNVSS
jgi:hypothetical protein